MPQAALKSNPLPGIGHNQPSPFEQSREEIETLLIEARNWADGTAVETQAQADIIAKLKDDLRAAGKLADERRIAENEPFDAGKAEVQARYNPLIQKDKGKVALATAALNKTLAPYLLKLERERIALAQKAREEATAKTLAAHEAFRAAPSTDLEAREKAEALAAEGRRAEAAATKAENDRALAKGGTGRAQGLRTSYRAEIIDASAFAKWLWTTRRDIMDAFMVDTAARLIREGTHTIPGVKVHVERGL